MAVPSQEAKKDLSPAEKQIMLMLQRMTRELSTKYFPRAKDIKIDSASVDKIQGLQDDIGSNLQQIQNSTEWRKSNVPSWGVSNVAEKMLDDTNFFIAKGETLGGKRIIESMIIKEIQKKFPSVDL